jgi:DNA-binding CsgD family transcriptional regulator
MFDWSTAAVTPLPRRVPAPAPASGPSSPHAVIAPAAPAAASRHRQPHRNLGPADFEFMLDCVADAMLVVDARARVLHANRAARELLGEVRDPARGCGALVFRDAATQRAFERVLASYEACAPIAAACGGTPTDDDADWSDPGLDDAPERQFLVRDATGGIVARATVEPLQRSSRDDTVGSGAHLVSMQRQPVPRAVSTHSLRALYGLTACEARVAATTLAAHSVDDLALRLGLSRNTVKTHLKRVFRKCEVASFAQLAALVATGPRLR